MNNIPTGRLLALDTFRGITIAAMILVNNPGSWDHVYSQLWHAGWIGWTFTDLIFPFFLFIAGVAMWFSFRQKPSDNQWALWKKIFRRAALIFLVGLFISWFPFYDMSLDKVHFAGVLQRIAVSYVIASTICISFNRKSILAASILLLLGYWMLIVMFGADDPFAQDAVFEAGIDQVAFRSCLASAVPIMIGYLVGGYIDRPEYDRSVFLILIGVGFGMILLGQLWSLELPIIKNLLWSSSYVVLTVGIAIVTFTICLWVIEKAKIRSWTFSFVLFGLNPLFLYALSIVLDKITWMIKVNTEGSPIPLHEWLHQSVFRPWAGDINGSLFYAALFVVLHWLIAYGLFRKNIFLKV